MYDSSSAHQLLQVIFVVKVRNLQSIIHDQSYFWQKEQIMSETEIRSMAI